MTLQPNFLPVGSILNYNTDNGWKPKVLDGYDIGICELYNDRFNDMFQPIALTPEILTEWCDAKRGKVFLLEYRISNRLFIFRDGKCFDYGSNVQLDYLHELQLLFLGMKQVLTVTIK